MATKDALMRAVDAWLATDTPGPLALDLHGLEERLSEIVAPLEAIVRDLATSHVIDGEHGCVFCGSWNDNDPSKHKPACPWRRAVEWVRDQETKT